MPRAAFQNRVPLADRPFFISATVQSLKDRLKALGIAYNENERKFVLYYRIISNGHTLPNMPAGHVPTQPTIPPKLPPVGPQRKSYMYTISKTIAQLYSILLTIHVGFSSSCSRFCFTVQPR